MAWMRIDPSEVESIEVEGLDLVAYGLFWWISWKSWEHGGLPDDRASILRALRGRIDGAAFDAAWAQVRPLLDADVDGKLRVPWVERTREETIGYLKSDANRQKLRRLKAKDDSVTRTSTDVTRTSADVHGRPPESRGRPPESPDVRTYGRTDEPTEVPPPAASVPPRAPRKQPTGPHAEFIAWWCERFQKETGKPYAFLEAKDGAAVKKLLGYAGPGGLQEAQDRAGRFFADPWYRGRALTLQAFLGAWNGLTGPPPPRPDPPFVDDAVRIRAERAERMARVTAEREADAKAKAEREAAWAAHKAKYADCLDKPGEPKQ